MTETVLDSSSTNALFRMAGDEGLLVDLPDGDGFLSSLRQRPLDDWHRQQILEQLILNSRIHTLTKLPTERVDGEFLSMGITHCPETTPILSTQGKSISPELIEGMLRSQGYHQTFYDWLPILEASNRVFNEVCKYEDAHSGIKLNSLSCFVRGMVDSKYGQSYEYKLAHRWNKAQSAVSPLLSAVQEFLQLSEYATEASVYLRTPIYKLSPNLVNLSADPIDNTAVFVYRLTTEKLGVMPLCTTLRDALELSRHPDAISLREQMAAWLTSFGEDRAALTIGIQREIEKASRSLVRAKRWETVGMICGHLSIPMSMAAVIEPFLGALGFGLKCVAVLSEDAGHIVKHGVRWVGFGSAKSEN